MDYSVVYSKLVDICGSHNSCNHKNHEFCILRHLDTLVTETSETFRTVVGMAIIKFGIENIFKYNDFGGHIPSNPEENLQTNDSELESNINESEAVIETVENTNNEGGSVG